MPFRRWEKQSHCLNSKGRLQKSEQLLDGNFVSLIWNFKQVGMNSDPSTGRHYCLDRWAWPHGCNRMRIDPTNIWLTTHVNTHGPAVGVVSGGHTDWNERAPKVHVIHARPLSLGSWLGLALGVYQLFLVLPLIRPTECISFLRWCKQISMDCCFCLQVVCASWDLLLITVSYTNELLRAFWKSNFLNTVGIRNTRIFKRLPSRWHSQWLALQEVRSSQTHL